METEEKPDDCKNRDSHRLSKDEGINQTENGAAKPARASRYPTLPRYQHSGLIPHHLWLLGAVQDHGCNYGDHLPNSRWELGKP